MTHIASQYKRRGRVDASELRRLSTPRYSRDEGVGYVQRTRKQRYNLGSDDRGRGFGDERGHVNLGGGYMN